MSRENLRNTWYCPVCAGRLSYGIYCITCKVEASFAWRTPEKPDQKRAEQEWVSLAARLPQACSVCGSLPVTIYPGDGSSEFRPACGCAPPEYQPGEDGDGALFAEAAADQADQEADHG